MKAAFPRALVLFLGALMLLSCASLGASGSRQAWRPPRPVAIKGESITWSNVVPSGGTWGTYVPWGGTGGLLVRDGDLVVSDASSSSPSCWFLYEQSDGDSLQLREEDGRLLLSGKTISVAPADNATCWEWLDQASAKDLRSLRFLMVPDRMDENRLQTLKKLAAVNHDLSLGMGSISSSVSAAALFKPRTLFLEDSVTGTELAGILAGQNQIETLIITSTDATNLDSLATLPTLCRLAIFDWDPATTGPLPEGMRALKSLLLSGSGELDASALAAVPDGIEEISLVEYDTITGIAALERFHNLRTLILNGSEGIGDLSTLESLKKLAWVGLPADITQEQFSAFIGKHTAVQIVELIECSEITDLSPLQRLTGLTGLVVKCQHAEELAAMDAVDQLRSLRFLGIPGGITAKDLARISEALPRTLVVPTCLGSGWILLVIPLAALMWVAGSRARSRRCTSQQGADRRR